MSQDSLSIARESLQNEAAALQKAANRLSGTINDAIDSLLSIKGRIVCTGLGKSGHIARKIAATLASTGSPAFFLHPSEALHGDLGMVNDGDAIIAIAYGGETNEVIEVVRYAKRLGLPVLSITGRLDSNLAKLSTFVLDGSVDKEICPHNLAPTTSSTLALALGDAIAIALMKKKGFMPEQFAELHPSGSLGRKLKSVRELMRQDYTAIDEDATFQGILEAIQEKNYGVVAVRGQGSDKVLGIITDGDLRRAVGKYKQKVFDVSAKEFMTILPKSISESALAIEAVAMMEKYKNTALLVEAKDTHNLEKVVGIITMHDLVEAKLI